LCGVDGVSCNIVYLFEYLADAQSKIITIHMIKIAIKLKNLDEVLVSNLAFSLTKDLS
jgi:hypothetical protein